MKTNKLLLFIALSLFIVSCTHENLTEIKEENHISNKNENYSQVTITGNSTNGFSDRNSKANSIEQIPTGESILFYSTGGVKAEGDILHYENGQWIGLKDNKWYTEEGPAKITAYYPVINKAEDLYYENGELRDFVYCKDTFNIGETIDLTFNHIFAKFVINIDKGLNDTIKKVHINIPQKVNSIDFTTGEYTTSANSDGTIVLEKNENGIYEFFIPCKNMINISFRLEGNNMTSKDIVISESEFKSGYEYICKVNRDNKKGINTTEDFIAFTHLINGETEYNGKKLEDLYTEIDGRRVFNLYNDLSFTDEELEKILLIKEFNDVFNGNNHKLSNLNIKADYESFLAIFSINKENGHIKNLIIENCKFNHPETKYYSYGSLLVGKNLGIIDNCHIASGTINMSTTKQNRYGGFVTINSGTIVNSSISNLQIENNVGQLGILVFQNNGNIFNCRINNNINKGTNDLTSSCICVYNTLRLYNIFVTEYKSEYYGICYQHSQGHYFNCILPDNYKKKTIEDDSASDSALREPVYYSDTSDEYIRITNELNNWIIDNTSKYPQFTFRKWKTDPTDKVIFE